MRFAFILLTLLIASRAQANDLLRLYGLALEQDVQLQAAAHARDAAAQASPQAFGALLPQINAGYQASKVFEEQTTTGFPCNSSTGSFNCKNEYINRGLSLTLDQALYNRAAFQRLAQSDLRGALAEAQFNAARQALALRVAEAYFSLLAAADTLRFAEAENRAVERSLEQSRQRFEVGLSAITDVQEAQARYDLTVAQKIQAEQLLANAREGLAQIVGVDDLQPTTLRDEIPLHSPAPADPAAWVTASADNNPAIVAARLQAQIAEKDIEISRSGHYPTVGVQAEHTDGSQGGRFSAEQTQDTISLQVRVPIYAGGSVQAGLEAARSLHRQRLAELEAAQRLAQRQTKDAYQGVLTGIALVKAQKQAVVSGTTALEASEVGLQVGARTAIDVLNAQRELYRAQRDAARSRYDYLLNVLRLKLAAGRLGADDLGEADALLQ